MEEIRKQLNILLKKHGYGFQYRVLKLVCDLANMKESRWIFEASEFPVEVQGERTKIDFILRLNNTRIYIVAECKRADPKFSNWCFVKAPYVRLNQKTEEFFVDRVRYEKTLANCRVTQDRLPFCIQGNAFHIGLVVKSKEKGELGKSERDVIEQAVTQVCRGVNGLIDLGGKRLGLIWSGADNDIGAIFIPVIFTTAKIYSCLSDLSLANLENGNLDVSETELEEEKFIYYQYHLSPGIKHSIQTEQMGKRFSDILAYEYIRTIPIVTATGINDFLCSFGGEILRILGQG
jgi:hypothetical protein